MLSLHGEVVSDGDLIRRQADGNGSRLNARHRLEPFEQTLIERACRILVGIPRTRQIQREGEQSLGLKSDIDLLQPDEAPDEQPGTDREHHGSGFRSTPLTVNIAVAVPMPSASVASATATKPGCRRSERTANRRSCSSFSTGGISLFVCWTPVFGGG